ncbi:MAG: hypothetical protein K2O18_14710 [Oscillospiraceae bacterium]|nr:hypothetical protein [Oscillospiraceae bacterium]
MTADTFEGLTSGQQRLLFARTRAKTAGKPMPEMNCITRGADGKPLEDKYDPEELDQIQLPMPKNFMSCFQYMELSPVQAKIESAVEQYFRGNLGIKDVTNVMDSTVSTLIETFTKIGFDPAETTPKIIEDVYEYCRTIVPIEAKEASFREGREVAGQFPEYSGGLYYSADIYYQTEDAIDAILERTRTLAEKYGVSDRVTVNRNYSEDTSLGRLMKSLNESYNTAVNQYYRDNYVCASIIDETMAPPRGFKMFYTDGEGTVPNRYAPTMGPGDGPYSVFDGGVHIWYGDWTFARRVPIGAAGTGMPCATNLLDVVKHSGQAYPKEIAGFLANFDFFSSTRCAEYLTGHPRKF